jgi:hypothetical protein
MGINQNLNLFLLGGSHTVVYLSNNNEINRVLKDFKFDIFISDSKLVKSHII